MSTPGTFPPWSDTVLRTALAAIAAAAVGLPVLLFFYVRTPYDQERNFEVVQPVQFDHRHHVRDDGIDCLYCHSGADRSEAAGVPATEVCMGCHTQIWNQSGLLAPVRASFFSGVPIAWNRVHDLPDFVYFNHAVHVRNGVDCSQCHGDVAKMPLARKAKTLTMGFCLNCHRQPHVHVPGYDKTPPVQTPVWRAQAGTSSATSLVVANKLITCTACHR